MIETISQETARMIEFIEAEAMAALFLAAPAEVRTMCGFHLARIGSAFALMLQQVDAILFNRVIGLGLGEPATEAMIDEIVAAYEQQGIWHYAIQLSPLAHPAELPAWLAARGLHRDDNWAKCYRGTEPPVVPTDLRIARVGPVYASTFAEIATQVFHFPTFLSPAVTALFGQAGWHHYLAFAGETPVATGALFVQNGEGYLCMGATLPAYRGRGAQGALMAQRIRDAIALGCRVITTETGEDLPTQPNPSYHNMLRTGFQLAYLRPNYVFGAR